MHLLRKYAVVKYHYTPENDKIHIHHLLGSYHWVAIDAEHVLLTAQYSPNNHGAIDNHPDVLLLPSLQTNVTLHEHAADRKKLHLLEPLKKHLELDHTHSAHHAVTRAVQKHGVRFEPLI